MRGRRIDYVALAEALYASAETNEGWLARVLESADSNLAGGIACGLSVVREQAGGRSLELADGRGQGRQALDIAGNVVEAMDELSYRKFWYPRQRVLLASSMLPSAPPLARSLYQHYQQQTGAPEFLGLVGHPAPGWAFVFFSAWPHGHQLAAAQKDSLERVRIHLETVLRLRLLGAGDAVAVLSPGGRVEHAEGMSRAEGEPMEERVRMIERARTQRGRADPQAALRIWKALVEGRWSLLEHVDHDGRRSYRAFENAPAARPYRRLSRREAATVEQSAQGLSGKHVAYALGVSEATVSKCLAGAARKLGFRNRTELLRAAAGLSDAPAQSTSTELLTQAEVDVLELLQFGHSNAHIANVRQRSERTVANQVASILKKTGVASRRALALIGNPAE